MEIKSFNNSLGNLPPVGQNKNKIAADTNPVSHDSFVTVHYEEPTCLERLGGKLVQAGKDFASPIKMGAHIGAFFAASFNDTALGGTRVLGYPLMVAGGAAGAAVGLCAAPFAMTLGIIFNGKGC
ncbi:MAG: hypothetical protein LWY06_18960 [Firmicutes bacterium]|nr:hypothetical protein [Bacillota bacterium]